MATALSARDIEVIVPELQDEPGRGPFWRQHAESAAEQLRRIPGDRPLVLAAHSGAGPLLPAIRERLPHPIAAYLFVDAGLPIGGLSRLGEMEREMPDVAAQLADHLHGGGRFPEWTDEDLREIVPDAEQRRELLADLRPRDLSFFTETIPVFPGWPDAPCAYLQFSQAYERPAAEALRRGWAYQQMESGHFHMLVDPEETADTLLDISS